LKKKSVGAFQANQARAVGEQTTVPACVMVPKRVGDGFEDFQKSAGIGLSDGFDQSGPDMRAGEVHKSRDSAKGGVVGASGSHFPKSGW